MFKKSLIFFSLLVVLVACERVSEEQLKSSNVRPPLTASTELAVATADIQTAQKNHHITVEIARTDEERARGLMERDSLSEDHGMWFVFQNNVQDSFWMKDTKIPLDILFVNEEGKVVDIISNTTPFSTNLLTPQTSYRYALEVNAGFVASRGIQKGDKVIVNITSP